MKLNVILASASAALLATTTTTSAFPLVPRSPSLDSFFGFSADPQAGFDERTHGKVWVNGVGPGREWAKGYGLGGAKNGREAWEKHHKEESSLWEEIWGMIVGPSQPTSEDRVGHRHGAGFQRVGGQRRPHDHDHAHEHHDGPSSHPAWRGKEHEHGGPGRRPHLASASGPGGRVHKGGCIWGRLSRALSHLAPHELVLLTTTLLLALFTLLRVVVMLVVLVRRYHAYANEVERPARGGEGEGYPGAEYRSRRGGYGRVKRDEEEVQAEGEKGEKEKE